MSLQKISSSSDRITELNAHLRDSIFLFLETAHASFSVITVLPIYLTNQRVHKLPKIKFRNNLKILVAQIVTGRKLHAEVQQ